MPWAQRSESGADVRIRYAARRDVRNCPKATSATTITAGTTHPDRPKIVDETVSTMVPDRENTGDSPTETLSEPWPTAAGHTLPDCSRSHAMAPPAHEGAHPRHHHDPEGDVRAGVVRDEPYAAEGHRDEDGDREQRMPGSVDRVVLDLSKAVGAGRGRWR